MDFEKCSDISTNARIVVVENKRKFTLRNQAKQSVRRVQVDGCLISDHRPRCDYLFEIGKKCHCAVYLELKGGDISKAFEQLVATIGYIAKLNRHRESKLVCHIVASRVPRAGPKVQNLKVQMARKYNALLLVDTNEAVVDLQAATYLK